MTDSEVIKAEIERLSTEIDQRNEMMANMGVELGKAQKNADIHLDHVRFLQKELKKFQDIESTINEFWDILLKHKIAKRKESPTLEEFAEAIQEIQDEAYKEFAEKLKERSIDIDVSFGYGKEHYTEAVTVIEIDNLLAELTPNLTKLPHSSLCETETYEGVTDICVGGKKNDFKE